MRIPKLKPFFSRFQRSGRVVVFPNNGQRLAGIIIDARVGVLKIINQQRRGLARADSGEGRTGGHAHSRFVVEQPSQHGF